MKKLAFTALMAVAFLSSCGSSSGLTNKVGTAAALIQQLSPNSTAADIANLFTALDTNKDEAISATEAAGTTVADNFNTLDKDNNSLLNLTELGGLLELLK